jgi:hypothetical protein
MPLLTKEKSRRRDFKYIQNKTPLQGKKAENSISSLVIVEQMVTAIRALINALSTGG